MKTRTFSKLTSGNCAPRHNARKIARNAFIATALAALSFCILPSAHAQNWLTAGNNILTTNWLGSDGTTNNPLIFKMGTTPSEVMRLTSAGVLEIGTTSASATRLQVIDLSAGDPVQFENNNSSSTLNFQNALSLLNVYTADTTKKPQTEIAMGSDDASGTGYCIATIDAIPTVKKTGSATGDLVFGVTNGSANNNSTERMRITSTGHVGIGTSSPAHLLQLSADDAAKPATNTWTIVSDARLKTNIRPFNDGLDVLLQINPVRYHYNGKGGIIDTVTDNIGIIAQEMQKVAPYTIGTTMLKLNPTDADATQILDYNSNAITYVTINAIKQLNTELTQANTEISSLKSELASLESKLDLLAANSSANVSNAATPSVNFYQNNPNPFSTSTKITYALPSTVSHAELIVTSEAGGIEVMHLPLVNGSNQIEINASDLAPGQYFYTVVADGITMPSKKMTVIK